MSKQAATRAHLDGCRFYETGCDQAMCNCLELTGLKGWRPIATAPRGESVLCYWPPVQRNDIWYAAYIGEAWRKFGNWFKGRDGYGAPTSELNEPTHWMPLPAPPERTGAEP